jgi:hypothetical protein
MIEQPKRGMKVLFRPPENAYSAFSLQGQVSGQSGILEAWNDTQARVRFPNLGGVNVNVCYLYDTSPQRLEDVFK